MNRSHDRTGSALMMALVVGLMVFSLAFAGVVVSGGAMRGAGETWESRQALYFAEAGVARAMRELAVQGDPESDGLVIAPTSFGSGSYQATATPSGFLEYVVRSTGSQQGTRQSVEVVIRANQEPVDYTANAAVVSNGPVAVNGNIDIDGRDWKADNSSLNFAGTDVYGVSSSDEVEVKGSAAVGGKGQAPINGADDDDGVYEEDNPWKDGVDNDGDGLTDEEAYDGLDDDGDGEVDEDTGGFPTNPDAVMGFSPGTLKTTAQLMGTYFGSRAALDAYLAANGGNLPGGKVFYLDFSDWTDADIGWSWNDPPSILVHHTAAGTAKMKNVHGYFKGLVLCDSVVHINDDTIVLGAIMSFAPFSAGNAYGNGNATIRYSSEVLANLPGLVPQTGAWGVFAWRQIAPE